MLDHPPVRRPWNRHCGSAVGLAMLMTFMYRHELQVQLHHLQQFSTGCTTVDYCDVLHSELFMTLM